MRAKQEAAGVFRPVLQRGHHGDAAQYLLEAGRYIDALQVTIGDVVSPLWTGVILVAANPRRAMLPP